MSGLSVHAQTIADLKEECSKFGTVLAVKVPRPEPASAAAAFLGTGNYGKVCSHPPTHPFSTTVAAPSLAVAPA